jgi:hypothetical protein
MATNKNQISNPYDSLALLHNNGLDSVIKGLSPKEVTIQKIIDLSSQYLSQVNNNQSRVENANYYALIARVINSLNQVPFSEIVGELKLSKRARCFIEDINNVSDEFDFETALKVVKNIEENILFSEIPQDEKQYPLLSASVAKLSIEYWIKQIEEPKSAWTPFVGDPKAFAWPWKSDANGAVAGAIGGAIAGSPALGGPGILVGGLVGAVGGAIGASVADALFPS